MIAFRHKKGDESQLEYCQTRLKASIHFVLYKVSSSLTKIPPTSGIPSCLLIVSIES